MGKLHPQQEKDNLYGLLKKKKKKVEERRTSSSQGGAVVPLWNLPMPQGRSLKGFSCLG